MKKSSHKSITESTEERTHHHHYEVTDTIFTDETDICQQLLDRYCKSSAPQHRHLCATAAATRSIIQSESLPLTPLSYFAATIGAIADTSKTLDDTNAVSALSSFLAILLPLVPENSIAPSKAAEAVAVLVELVERPSEAVSTASVRAVVKCLGVLLRFYDLEDWHSVKLGFETLLKFSIDKRPKVRKCAQDCVVVVFRSFESSPVIKEASKLVYSLFESYLPLAVNLTAPGTVHGLKDEVLLKPQQLEVLHMLSVLKLIVPYLSIKVSLKVLSELQKLMSSQFSALTRHIFEIIGVMFETSRAEVLIPEAENIIKSLASYVSLTEKNPAETVLSAANLLKSFLNKHHGGEPGKLVSLLSLVIGSIAGLLTSEASAASQASNILKELINHHIDRRNLLTIGNQLIDDEATCSTESHTIKSICAVFDNVLSNCGELPNGHILAVISNLFLKLGEISYFYMKDIIFNIANLMNVVAKDNSDSKYVQECIGSVITAMGPEKLLALLPISFNAEDLTCSNIWLLPILKNYVVGSSLGFFMEHFVPLAKSFERACRKVKKSVIGQDLQAHAHGCWELLPAFCRHPIDTDKNFEPLTKILIPLLKKDSFMLENIAIALQELVNQNRSVLRSKTGAAEVVKVPKASEVKDSGIELETQPSYSKKIASRNLRTLTSCSKELLQALAAVLFASPPERRTYVKDAIGCLASITDSSVTEKIFISSLKRFQLINDPGECEKLEGQTNAPVDKEQTSTTSAGKDAKRFLILELASSIVDGASEDLINLIFTFIRRTFQETDEIGQSEAYYTLNRILEEHSWFCSLQFAEVMDLLLGVKSPLDITSIKSRFACFQTLLVYAIKRDSDEENAKVFLMLNEIILTLKDSKEEDRKAAYDIILMMASTLRSTSGATSDGPYNKFISMIMGYLSGSSPHIKSGAVSALSILLYNDTDICLLMPDLVPSILALLQSKAVEVIKAVLGFVKVLVSSLQAKDIQTYLSDVVNGVLPWSSNSRHHFRSKVTVIMEIMMRKCGSAAVKSIAPGKYKGFVKSTLENRHGKTSSKEASTDKVEAHLSDSSPRGGQKRKRKELEISPEEGVSKDHIKTKREKRRQSTTPSRNKRHISTGSGNGVKWAKNMESQLQGGRRNKRNHLNSDPSDGMAKMKRTNMGKKNEGDVYRPAAASKFAKHKMVGKKHRIIKKSAQ